MPCACEVNRRLTYMQRKYGSTAPKSKATLIGQQVRLFFENFWLYLILLLIVPIIVLPVVVSLVKKRKIRLTDIPFLGKKTKNNLKG